MTTRPGAQRRELRPQYLRSAARYAASRSDHNRPEPIVFGWDIGGAHVKAAMLIGSLVHDVAQWPCPLWLGINQLDMPMQAARARWPDLDRHPHAITMTGEMADCFANREAGVARIAQALAAALPAPEFFAGDAGWCSTAQAAAHWQHIASANWLATARHTAQALRDHCGVLVDIGSTTTDLIAFAHGQVLTTSRTDAQRLEHSELVYQGVVRTPLCVLAQRIAWRNTELNVMNELFATTADVYRLTGELDPLHDQHPSADNAPKDAAATHARLARLIGLDARDGNAAEWLAFARAWRDLQLAILRGQLERVMRSHDLKAPALLVSTGCGDVLVPELVPPGWEQVTYADTVARFTEQAAFPTQRWAQVGAPSIAVAALWAKEHR